MKPLSACVKRMCEDDDKRREADSPYCLHCINKSILAIAIVISRFVDVDVSSSSCPVVGETDVLDGPVSVCEVCDEVLTMSDFSSSAFKASVHDD